METLRKASNEIGRRMVKVEGEREIGVSEATMLWTVHLALLAFQINWTGPGLSLGMDIRKPVVYGKKQQEPIENQATSV